MAFVLGSVIKIGTYTFKGGVYELKINKSIHAFVDSAKLTIPGLGQIVKANALALKAVNTGLSLVGMGSQLLAKDLPATSVKTAQLFKEGDPVSIDLGYNGDMRNEFRGFVRRVNLTTPITIDMEGYAWQLRNINILAKWKKTTLKEILTRVIQGTDIVLSPDIPDIKFNSFSIPNLNGVQVLDYLEQKMLLTVYFADNVLYAGIEAGRSTIEETGERSLTGLGEVKYSIGYNCVSNQPDLKVRLADATKVRVSLKTPTNTGKADYIEVGDINGDRHQHKIPYSNDPDYLKRAAAARLQKLKYNGFEGKLNGFLQPFCLPGWKAIITDRPQDGARAGSYFISGITVTFGVRGAKRIVEITYRLDTPMVAAAIASQSTTNQIN